MKNALLFLLTISLGLDLAGQSLVQQRTDSVCKLVVRSFNEKNILALYNLTGESFQKAISQESFTKISQTNLFPLGQIKDAVFEKETNGICQYKAVFAGMNLSMILGLDGTGKLQTFAFQPYVDPKAIKTHPVASSNSLRSPLDQAVDSAAQPYVRQLATSGLSIGIWKNGEESFYGYGETAKGNGQLPDQHTLFEIGSITKTFTAILLAVAVDNHKVSLDDPASRYLPDSIPYLAFDGKPVTLKSLSNHSSGLPRMPDNLHSTDETNPYKDYKEQDLFRFYQHLKLTRKPGDKYEYSNLAAATLGVILERLYKKSYQELFLATICNPLGMHETRQFLLQRDSAHFAAGYSETGQYNGPWDFQAMAPAGCIRSCASDLLIYARANLGAGPASLEKAIQLTHVPTFTDGTNKTGLGWHYIHVGKDELLFHNGGTGGYRTYLAINLEKKLAVVVLSNTAIGVEAVGNSIMGWLDAQP
jgi:CubicO group peptidase (beta-lactamase class C family)